MLPPNPAVRWGTPNLGEYEGDLNIDERLVADLVVACRAVAAKLDALAPIQEL